MLLFVREWKWYVLSKFLFILGSIDSQKHMGFCGDMLWQEFGSFVGGVMDYDYLSSIVSNYSNLTSLNTLGGAAWGGSSLSGNTALKGISSLLKSGGSLDSLEDTNSLIGANTFSEILENAMKEAQGRLVGIAGAGTDAAFDGEARSNMILQNYLYTAMMKDSLENSLTEKADFTSGLFSDMAASTEDSESNSTLDSLKDSTIGAIGNYSTYKALVDNSEFGDLADDVISSYGGQGALLREMLSSLSSELQNTAASEETQAHNRNFDSHLRLRSATSRRG